MNAILHSFNVFSSLRRNKKHSKLTISPNKLDRLSIILFIVVFIVRTIKYAIGLGTGFDQAKPSGGGSSNEQLFTLPNLSLYMPLRLTSADREVFNNAVKSKDSVSWQSTPDNAQVCLFLAASSEPALLLLLAKRGCPIRPLGAVNVRNRFEILDPQACHSLFNGRPDSGANADTYVLARFPRPARRVRRGIEIDVEVSIMINQTHTPEPKLSQPAPANSKDSSDVIFRQEFTMLQFMKFKDTPSQRPKQQPPPPNLSPTIPNNITFKIPMSRHSPHLWARLCKDYNPIHFSPFLAKLLGQPGQLAHGNHAVGVCVHSLTIPSSTSSSDDDDEDAAIRLVRETMMKPVAMGCGWGMEIRFRRPVVLPAIVGVRTTEVGTGFEVVDVGSGKTCVEVSMGPLQ